MADRKTRAEELRKRAEELEVKAKKVEEQAHEAREAADAAKREADDTEDVVGDMEAALQQHGAGPSSDAVPVVRESGQLRIHSSLSATDM